MDVQKLYFPASAQPDIIRSVQKDKFCLGLVEGALREVVHANLGPSALVKHGDAIRTTSCLVYYACTTGTGEQTLGEEFCDILQVSSNKLFPNIYSRLLLVLLHTLIPVFQARVHAAELADEDECDSGNAGQISGSDDEIAPIGKSSSGAKHHGLSELEISSAFNSAHDLADVLLSDITPVPADTLATPPDSNLDGPVASQSGVSSPIHPHIKAQDGGAKWSTPEVRSVQQQPPPSNACLLQRLKPICTRFYARAFAPWSSFWKSRRVLQAIKWLPVAAQIHLVLFYVFGLYFEFPKRLAGIQYIYFGSSQAPRRYFGVVGVLLMVQVLVNARNTYRSQFKQPEPDASDQQHLIVKTPEVHTEDSHQDPPELHPQSLGITDVVMPAPARTLAPCPLCFAECSTPTCLPCGHIMCWNCAVEWCLRKPSCPICRHAAPLNELIPLVHALV